VRELQRAPAGDAPPPHNRARPLHEYDESTRRAIERARHLIDAETALASGRRHPSTDRGELFVHQACAALPYYLDTYPLIVERSWHKLALLGVPARSS
jgi:hypothetical protein